MKPGKIIIIFYFVLGLLVFSYSVSASDGDIFPATIRITAPPETLNEIVRTQSVDFIGMGFVDLFVTFEIYQQLLDEFTASIESGMISIRVLQSARESAENFGIQKQRYGYGYHNYETMVSELKSLESSYSQICKLYDIGDSEDGFYDIWAMKISDHAERYEDELTVFFTGGHHGNEKLSVEMVLHIINYLLSRYGKDENVTDILNRTQIWLLPMINPWGYSNNKKGNVRGVDLCRDYLTPFDSVPSAETQAVMDGLIGNHYFVAGIDYHSYGEHSIYPLSEEEKDDPFSLALKDLSDDMAQILNYGSLATESFLKGTRDKGSFTDYHFLNHNIPGLGVMIGNSHSPPVSLMEQICSSNMDGALMLLERVHGSALTGNITLNNQPLISTLTIKKSGDNKDVGISIDSEKKYGRYHRILSPGTYDVEYAYNKQRIEKHGIQIVMGQSTTVNIDFAGNVKSASDGFESGDLAGGTGWKNGWLWKGSVRILEKKPFDGRYYIRLRKNNAYLKRTLDLSSAISAKLVFASRIRSFEKNDVAYVRVSPDGKNFHTVKSFTLSDNSHSYAVHEVDLSPYKMTSDFSILFMAEMDEMKDSWYLDNIGIRYVEQSE